MSETKQKNTLIHDALILFAITLIAAVALGFVYEITKDPIAQAEAKAKIDAYKAVFPEMTATKEFDEPEWALENAKKLLDSDPAYEGVTVDEILMAEDGSGALLGYVLTVTSTKGYGGKITMTMGVSRHDGILKGIEFLTISETPGLGMNAKEDKFKSQFKDAKVGQYSLSKRNISGDTEIDAISSATITTTAVTRSVNAGLKVVRELLLNAYND
ncbi:MAG: RnfABCDGE type electron transport complex subunit G [Lachnospiraceae bacterium]|nr:RnfABCDGE type electron transport complex subunit G [Lachnospiraceae bacterium]